MAYFKSINTKQLEMVWFHYKENSKPRKVRNYNLVVLKIKFMLLVIILQNTSSLLPSSGEKNLNSKFDRNVRQMTIANLPNKWLEAQGPCTGHRSNIAILYCFSFK